MHSGMEKAKYECCMNPAGDHCTPEITPSNIKDPACKNAWVRKCATSSNITTTDCRTFAKNLMQEHISDMDLPVRAFCAMNREPKDEHYEDCKCVNFDNTCVGQKIMKYKAGNPGCYYPDCKKPDVFKTSDLSLPECKSITCTMKDIKIIGNGAHATFNQSCGNQGPDRTGPPPVKSDYDYSAHTKSTCSGNILDATKGHVSAVINGQAAAKQKCREMCDAREDCNAYELQCPHGENVNCVCRLYDSSGFRPFERTTEAVGNYVALSGEECDGKQHIGNATSVKQCQDLFQAKPMVQLDMKYHDNLGTGSCSGKAVFFAAAGTLKSDDPASEALVACLPHVSGRPNASVSEDGSFSCFEDSGCSSLTKDDTKHKTYRSRMTEYPAFMLDGAMCYGCPSADRRTKGKSGVTYIPRIGTSVCHDSKMKKI